MINEFSAPADPYHSGTSERSGAVVADDSLRAQIDVSLSLADSIS
jgi:hypothetical protein